MCSALFRLLFVNLADAIYKGDYDHYYWSKGAIPTLVISAAHSMLD